MDRGDENSGRYAAGRLEGRSAAPSGLPLDVYIRASYGSHVDTTDGREVGIVEDVVVEPRTGRVVQIEVRGGWFGRRRRTVAPYQVEAVDPVARRLVVSAAVVQDSPR